MQIDGVRIEGGELILKTKDPAARRLAYNFKPGNYEFVKMKEKRSKDANAKMWAICEEIARAVTMTKEEVYRQNIREVGVYTPLPIKNELVDEFKRIWRGRGVGWFADVIDDSKIKGYKLIFAYHGSSVYTTAEMARLIDSVIQDAKSVGLDVMDEREKSLLLEEWGK